VSPHAARILAAMTAPSELAADLAKEIRLAVSETSPPPTNRPAMQSSGEEEGARLALERAARNITPSIPPGAPLSFFKKLALRALRFLWRDQAAFNALTLESLQAILAGLASQRKAVDQFDSELAGFRKDQASRQSAVAEMKRTLQSWERRAAIEDGRLSALEALSQGRTASPPASAPPGAPPTAIPPGVYSLFEERFRGRPDEILARQRDYAAILAGLPGPVLDVGCGRGELLRILAEKGIPARGVEINPIAAAEARGSGLEVEEGDAIAALAQQPAGSLGAVVALQVVEHWTAETVFTFLREARRALAAGGLLLLETINTDTLSAWKTFYLDPSHVRPVPPESLRFLAEAAGFGQVRIEYRAPLPVEERLEEKGNNEAKLNRLLFGPQDYALIGFRPAEN
ncbi:MAG TPA: class I SAM-dependent methyltransferase, partial [Thermoanaerobaculia bacterium]|nr:class I SAM-dependent methyltransferase [Thermoanaerobaculia bacterium]